MLSRLSGLANTVLHELSGEGEDAGAGVLPAEGSELPATQQNEEEMPEDVLERLAHMERLVVQLKDLVWEKDGQLQQKDALLQEERQASEARLAKLKVQAKAKLASLNKRIEDLTAQGAALPTKDQLGEPLPPSKPHSGQGTRDEQREEVEVLQRRLQEQEKMVEELQEQLAVAAGRLPEAQAQLSSLQEEIREKDSRLEEQARRHQAELDQLSAQSALEVEMQQNLRLLQRKLEEQEAALLGRTQVVDLLQQELNGTEEQKQIFLEKWQQAEAELDALRNASSSERQESRSLVEKLELALAEQKLAFHRLQEETQQLSQERDQARAEQADLQRKSQAAERRHAEELEEKGRQIAELQRAERELRSSCDALRAENAQLQLGGDRPPEHSAESVSIQQGKLPAQSTEPGCSPAGPEVLAAETAGQVSTLKEPAADQDAASPLRGDGGQGKEQHKSPAEALEAGNETLCAKIPQLEERPECAVEPAESNQVTCTEMGGDTQPVLVSGVSAGFGDGSPGLVGPQDGLQSDKAEGLSLPGAPATQSPASPGGSPKELPATENGQPDILEYLSAKKHTELSVLLLELQEAQEEIAFLKGQLRDSSSPVPEGIEPLSRMSQASSTEQGGEKRTVLLQSDSSSSSLITVEIREESPPPIDVISEQDGPFAGNGEAAPKPFLPSVSQQQELAKLELETAELRASRQKAEELHRAVLDEKVVEMGRLRQLVEDSGSTLHTLTAERDRLLSQLKELCSVAELKEQVRQLEGDLASSEKRRLSDWESGISQLDPLKEQIQSLKNEAKSKEVKIEALQKDLDKAQHCLAEQEHLGRSLSSRLQEKEQAVCALVGQLEKTTARVEELSQSVTTKELEAAGLESLVSEKSAEIERLQQEVVEQEQRAAEVSISLSDRMVQLNEEKFSLGKELKSVQEHLSTLLQEKERRDQAVGTEEAEPPEQRAERAPSAGEDLEVLRKENEQVKKRLQTALVSRKELLSKVRKLERELEGGKEQPAEPGAESLGVQEKEGGKAAPPGSGGNAEGGVAPSLGQLLSPREAEPQTVPGGEEESVAAPLESMQEREPLLDSLQGELKGHGPALDQQAPANRSSELLDTAGPTPHMASSAVDPSLEEQQRAALEEKVSALEEEKEQLQKKLQDALASRKDTIKKAQEKDRHHREQLKQQKDDYSLLQEQFEQQRKEKENIQGQLQQLQALPAEGAALEGSQPALGAAEEPGWEVPAGVQAAVEDLAVEQFKAELKELRAEKGELEAQVSRLEGELASESEAALRLQNQVAQLLAEVEAAKSACCRAEADVASLRLELEERQAEAARQESLRLQHMALEEQKELASKDKIEGLSSQLVELNESLHGLRAELQDKEDTVQALQGQLETQSKEQTQRLQAELAEMQQKSAEGAAEEQSRAQLQRKLQAALISRKEVLKESKLLREELASTKASLESASLRLFDAESQASTLEKEKEALLEKLVALGEEREKLIAEVDRALVENQNLSGSCESLKLALEGVTQEKAKLEDEVGSLRRSQAEELAEWQEKHKELQKEYETLLQSYENISNEAERIQQVMEGVRQEKQELFLRLKGAEAEKREVDARLQGAEQEMEGMKEKMRKFAKSKQQKILELEEENEQLRSESHSAGGDPGKMEEPSSDLRGELENCKKNCESFSDQLEALLAEKDTLRQEVLDLRQALQSKGQEGLVADSKEVGSAVAVPPEAGEGEEEPLVEPAAVRLGTEKEEEEVDKAGPVRDEINEYAQKVGQLTLQVAELEKMRGAAEELSRALADVETLREEKEDLENLLAAKGQELEVLQEKLVKAGEAHQRAEEQLARATRLKGALEAEKDDLEERLMNQLAELNGSIGNYQQDASDLQSKNQQLLNKVEALQGALHCLEDEKRHLLREKADRKEHVGKLKSDNRRTQAKELQELLREKQQEVRQLQKDCIKSQEKVSSLERTIKALEFVQSESQKELESSKRSLAKAGDDTRKAQAELAACRVLLDDTQSEAARVLAESLKVKEELQASKEQARAQLKQKEDDLEQRLDRERGKHAKELSNMQGRLEALRKEQVRSEGTAHGLLESLRQKDQEAKQLQGSLNYALAQLAAFTRSMSSLQDDRDRVIEEARRWEEKFSEAIEKKEQEVRARGAACAALEEQAKQRAAQVEDLQSRLASLERDTLAQESSAQEELQRHQKEASLLQEEQKRLAFQLEEAQQLFSTSQNQIRKQEAELQSLKEQLVHLQGSFSKCEEAREELENQVKRQEVSLQESRFSCEQLAADLQASKELTDRLHEEMSSKDQKIIGLLAAKEEAVSAAVLELQQRHKEELRDLEGRVGKGEEERAALEGERRRALEKAGRLVEKLRSAQEESKRHKVQLESFTKSMFSLQDDRDRVLGDYRQLEQRHVAAILEKDQLIQEAAAENNTLKEELRSLHGRMDDLHAENAKLDAELVRYREDLNQLISIKDCQQKQLLGAQLERIQELEKKKAGAEAQLGESACTVADLRLSVEALQQEKRSVEQELEALAASLSRTQGEVAALREGGPMLELQAQLQSQADGAQELSSQLSLAQHRVRELEEELNFVHKTTAQKLHEAEEKMRKELKSLHHDARLMRNETETAEERVAELAKDLLEMEQNLLTVTEENQDLKAQIQSFKKAMSSLQDSWDQSNEELRAVERKYAADVEEQSSLVQRLREEKAEGQREQERLAKEKDALAAELGALRASVEEKGLLTRLEKLNQQLQDRDVELLRLASELEGASGQVKSFSKAMASLQGERDRLVSELDQARNGDATKPQSAASASASPAEVKGLKKALSSLQNDRDRLLSELKNLQQQYLQAGVDTAEMARLAAQLQAQKQETEQERHLQEQLRQERASWQLELQQLREEKAAWEREATSTKEQQLSHLQRTVREARPSTGVVEEERLQRQAFPEVAASSKPLKGDASSLEAEVNNLQAQLRDSLKEVHQKEERIQQLNSKLSQVFEEKNSLSLQLRGSSRNLRESQQHYSQVLAHCEALKKQLQELHPPGKATGSLSTDAAPGAPQERSEHPRESYTPELQELQMKLSEAKQQQSSAKQGLLQLEELLLEERDQRLAAEVALSAAQDHIRRLEASEWAQPFDTSIEMPSGPERALIVAPTEGSFSKGRGSTGLRRVLRVLCGSRRRLPLLATLYLLAIHVLLLLCFTGRL